MPLILNRSGVKPSNLRHFNNALTVVVVALGMYLVIMPIWPYISFWLLSDKTNPYQSSLQSDASNKKPIPNDNRLVIPQMGLDAAINEGNYASTLSQGAWRRPQSSTPDQNSNTVIVAHRFTYSSPALFYHLDKLKASDKFSLYWDKKEYVYQVREIKVVEPNEVSIEDRTDSAVLTLYTCTPMWTAKQRLVVISDLIEDQT